jgi:hypothetical protein
LHNGIGMVVCDRCDPIAALDAKGRKNVCRFACELEKLVIRVVMSPGHFRIEYQPRISMIRTDLRSYEFPDVRVRNLEVGGRDAADRPGFEDI